MIFLKNSNIKNILGYNSNILYFCVSKLLFWEFVILTNSILKFQCAFLGFLRWNGEKACEVNSQ